MKKTLYLAIAAATALTTTATFAETVYENDDLTLEIKGEVDSQFRNTTVDNSDVNFRFDDVDFAVKASKTTDSGVTAFSYFKTDLKSGSADLSQAYVGIEAAGASLTLGKNDYSSDEFGIGQDIEFGVDQAILDTSGDEVFRLDYNMDALYVSASFDVPVDNDGNDDTASDESSFDLYAQYVLADSITVAGVFQTQKADEDADSYMALGASIEYSRDAITAGAEVTYTDVEGFVPYAFGADVVNNTRGVSGIDGITAFQIAGAYDVTGELTVGAGFGMQLLDKDFDDPMQVYGNVAYTIAPAATIYGELQYDIIDDDSPVDSELGYAAGMKVKF